MLSTADNLYLNTPSSNNNEIYTAKLHVFYISLNTCQVEIADLFFFLLVTLPLFTSAVPQEEMAKDRQE